VSSVVGARGPSEVVVRCGERSRSQVDVGLQEAVRRGVAAMGC